jgi:hypothetical protein
LVAALAGTALVTAATAAMTVTTAVLMPMSLSVRGISNHGASQSLDGGACLTIGGCADVSAGAPLANGRT